MPERTIATELPQELSRLPEQPYGFSDVSSCPKDVESAAQAGDRNKAGRAKKAAAISKTRNHAVFTSGFLDDGHPTIFAATRG